MSKLKYTIKHDGRAYGAPTKTQLVLELVKKGVVVETAEELVREEFMTEKQRVAITKKTNTASIKVVSVHLTLARKLNATLNSRNGKAWAKCREMYAKHFDISDLSNKQVEKAILTLVANTVKISGFDN